MRASVTSLSKKLISTFFAATLVMGLVPAAAFAANENTDAAAAENSQDATASSNIQAEAKASAYENDFEDLDATVISSEGEKSAPIEQNEGEALTNSSGEDEVADNTTGSDDSITIPAATERINEDVMLTTPVAQQETTKNYFLAQTLESTRTVPIVSANLPLDKGSLDVNVVTEPDAEGESSATSEEDGEDSDDPDGADDLATTDDPVDASFTLASSENDSAVSAESTVIGSFTYLGMTFAIEPGGETVALVAVDYNKLPEAFIEKQIIAIPETVTPDGIDYYSVTRIADHTFASLKKENANEDYKGCEALFTDEELLSEAGIDASEAEVFLNPETDTIDIDNDGEADAPANPLKDCTGILAVGIPASVTSIGDNALSGSDTLQYLVVPEDNSTYASYDGALYSADLTNLRLIPEGRVGAVRVAPSATDVSPEAFSHCPSVTTLVADPESETYQLLKGSEGVQEDTISNVALIACLDDVWALRFASRSLTACYDALNIANPFYFVDSSASLFDSRIQNMSSMNERTVLKNAGFTLLRDSPLPSDFTDLSCGLLKGKDRGLLTLAKSDCEIVDVGKKLLAPGAAADSATVCADTFCDGYLWGHEGKDTTYCSRVRYDTTYGFYIYNYRYGTQFWNYLQIRDKNTKQIVKCRETAYIEGSVAIGAATSTLIQAQVLIPPPYGYDINWDSQGGSAVSPWLVPYDGSYAVKTAPSYAECGNELPRPTRTGYTFSGWYTSTAYTTQVTADTIVSNEVTFYAKWTLADWSITIDAAGGTIYQNGTSTGKSSLTYNSKPGSNYTTVYGASNSYAFHTWRAEDTTTFTQYSVAKVGYTLSSWTLSTGGVVNASTGSAVLNPAGSGARFTAGWTINTYNVAVYCPVATSHVVHRYSGGAFHSGYSLGSDNGYAPSATQCNRFTMKAADGQFLDLIVGDPSTDEYNHMGYQSTQVGYYVSNAYYWDANRTQPVAVGTYYQNATLYLGWGNTAYTLAYGANGGSGTHASTTNLNIGSVVTLPSANNCGITKTGYTLTGWKAGSSVYTAGGTVAMTTIAAAVNAAANLTTDTLRVDAVWTANKYTLTVNPNGGKLNNSTNNASYTMTYDSGDYNVIGSNAFSRDGHTFTGLWTDAKGGTQIYDKDGVSIKGTAYWNAYGQWCYAGSPTLYAHWEPIKYDVTFKVRGMDGKWTESKSQYEYGGTINFISYGSSDQGWRFESWYYDEACTNQVQGSPSTTTMQPLVFYAQWVANEYNLTFDVNGGTGGVTGPIKAIYASDMPELPENWKPTREGYEFTGWYRRYKESGYERLGSYYDAEGRSARKYDVAGNLQLEAGWSRWPFHAVTLSDSRLHVGDDTIWYWPERGYTPFNVNGLPEDGSQDDKITPVIDAKSTDRHIVTPPFCEDYEFLGYFDENGVQKIDEFGNLLTDEVITEATVWYAKWERLGSAVELKASYGDMVAEDIVQGTDKIEHVAFDKDFATLLDGSAVTKIAQTPTRVGYTFLGYYTEENPELSTEDVKNGKINGKLWIYGEGVEDVQSGTLVGETWLTEDEWAKAPTNLVDKGAITLYAAWQLDDCIVTFDEQIIFDEKGNPKENIEEVDVKDADALKDRIWHYNKNMDETLPAPSEGTFSRNGYDFGGWYYLKDGETVTRVSDKDGNPDANALLPWKDPIKNVTLYAYWTPRHYAVQFDPAFPNIEGVAQVYGGPKDKVELDYDDALEMHVSDFGAYDFKGWYVGVPDGMGGWEAGNVPFSDWTTRDDVFVEGAHTTAVTEKSEGVYVGCFTPQDPLVGQTYDADAIEPAIIHVVAKWDDPVKRYIHLYAGIPGQSVEESKIPSIPQYYEFATAYPSFPQSWLPTYGQDGWKCMGWVEVENEDAAKALLASGDQEPEDDAGITGIEAKVTRAAYHDLYFVAKWTICPLSVTLETEENEQGTYVKGTDGFLDEVSNGDARTWKAVSKPDEGERSTVAAYDVRATPFTLPDLARRGYDFKGWRLQGTQDEPEKRLVVDPAVQARDEATYDLVFEPVFEEITYRIVLDPNGGGLEEQVHERKFTDGFVFYCPVALHTGSIFQAWATQVQEPLVNDGTYREFHDGDSVPLAPTEGIPFCLTDLLEDGKDYVDDAPRTITLYGIWFGDIISVKVPLTVNMAIDTETGDVVAAKTPLTVRSGNEDRVYTVESLHYEPVSTEKGVPFEGANEVYFSIYPGLDFKNGDDAYYFLQKNKVGDQGEVTYTSNDGEKTAKPILVKLGNRTAPSVLFTRTSLPSDYVLDNMAFGDTTLDAASGFRPFSADDPLDVYYGIHFGDSTTWKSTLQKFAFSENADHWTLPRNDAGYQRYTGLPDDEGRRLGWSSDRVDIAKVRYTLSMKTKNQ